MRHLACIFLLFTVTLSAQEIPLDSLNEQNLDRIRQMDQTVIVDLHKARIRGKEENDPEQYILALKNLGGFYLNFEQFDSARHYLDLGIAVNTTDTLTAARASLFINRGIMFFRMGDPIQSYDSYLKAMVIVNMMNDTIKKANLLLNMALADGELGRRKKAIEKMEKALKYRGHEPWFRVRVMANLGIQYSAYGDTAKAIEIYLETMEKALEVKHYNIIWNTQVNLANIYMHTEQFADAEKLYVESIETWAELDYKEGISSAYSGIGNIRLKQEQYVEAIEFYEKALDGTKDYPALRVDILRNLKTCYESQKDFEKAYFISQEVFQLNDSINRVDQNDQVEQYEKRYLAEQGKLEAKQKELEARQRELILSRQIVWLSLGLLLSLLVIAIILFRRQKARNEAEKRELLARQEKEKLEIQLLRSQMNPHFFFNALYSIQNFILTNEPLESSRFLSKFARLMRSTLEWNDKELIPLADEIQIQTDYLELEQLRFDDKFHFEVICPQELKESVLIPPMVVQPFLENAIVHGFRHMERDGHLVVEVKEEGKGLRISVIDNGAGLSGTKDSNGTGKSLKKESLALKLTEKRMKLLSQRHSFQSSFTLINRADKNPDDTGVQVDLILPLIKE